MDGQMDRWNDGWLDGCVNQLTDGWGWWDGTWGGTQVDAAPAVLEEPIAPVQLDELEGSSRPIPAVGPHTYQPT
eukprot:scaffold502021_cov23-Prasinocladus_malaysianus.AAC.1